MTAHTSELRTDLILTVIGLDWIGLTTDLILTVIGLDYIVFSLFPLNLLPEGSNRL